MRLPRSCTGGPQLWYKRLRSDAFFGCYEMFLRLSFDNPAYLWLLLGLPLLWWIGYGSLAALGRYRRGFALLFRSTVWVAIVFAIAGRNWYGSATA